MGRRKLLVPLALARGTGTRRALAWAGAAALAAGLLLSHGRLQALYPAPLPHLDRLVVGEEGGKDLALALTGFRRAAADLAWIRYLQFLSRGEGGGEEIRRATLGVVRLDPYFITPYIYGASTLAFDKNIDEPQAAMELLREGIRHNPGYWRLQAILASILYKQQKKPKEMMAELERLAAAPGCPSLVRAILANLYRKSGEYGKAASLWMTVLESETDPGEISRARRELGEIRELARKRRKNL